jgi:hypothetical protein
MVARIRRPAAPKGSPVDFSHPRQIQDFLDAIEYSDDTFYRCPARVAVERKANCVDGALFAAAALRRLGHRPLILDMEAERDDDHAIALFQVKGAWGCLAKSNVVPLRYREPVYRTVRELVMSFFDFYYNLDGEKALRSHTRPIDLSRWDALNWETDDACIEPVIVGALYRAKHWPLLTADQIAGLSLVDARLYDACLLGSKASGLYQPKPR